jgi:hypothetical protein
MVLAGKIDFMLSTKKPPIGGFLVEVLYSKLQL